MNTEIYQIKLPQFEGPFDLLLFFIERDELDIYNIPITKITNEFLDYIHKSESLNIELSSEFILFISTLMRIKAKMLLPRKELDAEGKEIGKVTSGTQAPSLNKAIGLGYVTLENASVDIEIFINIRDKNIKAKVVKIPFE